MASSQVRALMDAVSDHRQEWQGMPVPVPGFRIRLCEGHPLAEMVAETERILDPPAEGIPVADAEREVLVNEWFSYSRHARVYLVRNLATGRLSAVTQPVSPDQSMRRLNFALSTLGVSDAWALDAEASAIDKLLGLLTDRQARHYMLTGSFLETSPRSNVSYLFRRLRPTVALSPRNRDPRTDSMRCLAVLCLHPVGFYEGTWAGCMTPTDDVIAHLLMVRGDEPGFWRQANQHPSWTPEAGL